MVIPQVAVVLVLAIDKVGKVTTGVMMEITIVDVTGMVEIVVDLT